MKRMLVVITVFIGLLSGCSNDNKTNDQTNEEQPQIIEVEVKMEQNIQPNKPVVIQAVVTQGKQKVDDAKEVKFEVWKKEHENHEMIKGENKGDGTYEMTKSFSEPGEYMVTAHVTARDMHAMPKTQFTVGEAPSTTTKTENTHEHGKHHHSETIIVMENKQFTKDLESELSVFISHNELPLEKGKVSFEIWKGENQGKPVWVSAADKGKGYYSAPYTFTTPGIYHIQIHLEKAELHDHRVEMIEVK